jgi:hypothetical protein
MMLFLAVFCGFLAEYQLEHKIEKERGKQYLHSFYEDLKKDTLEIQQRIAEDERKLEALATVHACFDTVMAKGNANPCLAIIIRHAFSFRDFVYNDRTIQQLKNAGGMRLLNKENADSIIAYDNRMRSYLDFQSSLIQERQTMVRNNLIKMISFNGLRESRSQPEVIVDNKNASYLLTTDTVELNRFFNELFMYMITINRRLGFLETIHEHAKQLLGFFRDKHRFE